MSTGYLSKIFAIQCLLISLLALSQLAFAQSPWTQLWPKPNLFGYQSIHIAQNGQGILLDNQTQKLLYTENFGRNWIDHPDAMTNRVFQMSFTSDSVGYAWGGNFIKTTDRGRTWTRVPINTILGDVDFVSNTVGFNFVSNGRLSRTTDGGATWQLRGNVLSNLLPLCAASVNTLYARGAMDILFRSTDGGTSWNSYVVPGTRKPIMWMDFATPNIGIGLGDSGTIARTTDGGTSWQISYVADSSNPASVVPFSLHNIKFFSSTLGAIRTTNVSVALVTTNAGETWRTVTLPQPVYFTMASENLFFGYEGAYIGVSTNGGRDWQQLTKGDLNEITGASFQNQNRLWIANGKLKYTDDKGLSFVDKLARPNHWIYDVKFRTPNIGYALERDSTGGGMNVLKTTNGGNTWARREIITQSTPNVNIFRFLERLQFIHPDTGFAYGMAGIFKTVDGGESWQTVYANIIGNNVNRVFGHFTSGKEGIRIDGFQGTLNGVGQVYKTFDGGLTWSQINVVRSPNVFEAPHPRDVHFLDKNNGWYVGRNVLVRTTDGGNSWVAYNLPGNGYSVCFLTPLVGYVSGDFLDPYFTTDGGITWSRTTENRLIANNNVLLSLFGKLAVMAGAQGGFYVHEGFQRNLVTVVKGSAIKATSTSCGPQSSRLPLGNRLFKNENNYYSSTDEQGEFNLWLDSGAHQIKQVKLNSILSRFEQQQCPPNDNGYDVVVQGLQDTIQLPDFVNNVRPCPVLTVNQSHFLMRPCRGSNLNISVQNQGNAASTPTFIQVKFPQYLLFVSANKTWDFNALDSTYRFQLPALQAGENYFINIMDSVICNPNLLTGANLCVTTKIENAPDCLLQSTTNWDGVDLEVASRCLNGQTRFIIRNNGSAMPATSRYRIFAGADLAFEANFQLAAFNQMTVSLPTNAPAAIYRLEVPQSANHPLSTFASAEADCANGTSTNGLFPPPSQSPLVDIVCVTVTNAYDPNDKLVWPKGVGTAGNIEPGTELKYTLRFQNTGTDTAFNVVVTDTLSQHLNVETLQLGLGSHPYRLTVTGKDRPVLNFHFDDIMLPDSNRNEPLSHGQVSFTISPKANLPLGTRIENFTDIYFDFNDPIRTNTTVNTLYRPTVTPGIVDTVFVTTDITSIGDKLSPGKLQLKPNPSKGQLEISTAMAGRLQVLDLQGVQLETIKVAAGKNQVQLNHLPKGLYLIRLHTENGVATEKLVIE